MRTSRKTLYEINMSQLGAERSGELLALPKTDFIQAVVGASNGFFDRLQSFGDAVALCTEGGEHVSYRELAARADARADEIGVGRQLVVVTCSNSIETVVNLMACWRSSHASILVGDGVRASELSDGFQASMILAADKLEHVSARRVPLHDDLRLLLSTSGSTGSSKLVRLSGRNLDANARSIAQYLDLSSADRAITSLPLHYSYGLSVLNSHLSVGATLLLSGRSVTDPEFFDFFEREGGTSLAGVPYTYDLLEASGFRDRSLTSLRTLTQAGGRLSLDLAETYARWSLERNVRFYVMYGQTEATARISYVEPSELLSNLGTIGMPIPGGMLAVDGSSGEPGELVYTGPNVMMGYARDAEDLALPAGPDILRTGDMAVVEPNGFFRVVGRQSRFLKLFGLRVSLDEVETILARAGHTCAAAGNDNLLAVAIEGSPDATVIRQDLASTIGIPTRSIEVELVEELPRLPSGKVDYAQITQRAVLRHICDEEAPAAGIMDAFQQTFAGRRVSQADSFTSLGGDSLSYVMIAAAIEDELGSLPQGWEEKPISDLIAHTRSSSRFTWTDSELIARALAIAAIVTNHASNYRVGGGAEALLMLVGYNWARFQRQRIARNEFWQAVVQVCRNTVLPVYVMTVIVAVAWKWPGWSSLFLVSNFVGRYHSFLEPFWFIEALAQLVVIVAIVLSFRPVRDVAIQRPLAFGMGLLAIGLITRGVGPYLFNHERLSQRTPDMLLYLPALGWCIHSARRFSEKLLVALTVLTTSALISGYMLPGLLSETVPAYRQSWVVCLAGLLLFLPRIPMPRIVRWPVVALAGASFTIYIVHTIPLWLINRRYGDVPEIKIAAGLTFGILVNKLVRSGFWKFPALRKEASS